MLAAHGRLLREAFSSSGGVEVDTQGDGLFYAFSRAPDAVVAAAGAQRALAHIPGPKVSRSPFVWASTPASQPLGDEGYVGAMCIRPRASARPPSGQEVVSETTSKLVGDGGAGGVELRYLGTHGLKDLCLRSTCISS